MTLIPMHARAVKRSAIVKNKKQSEDKSLKGYGQTIHNKKPLRRLESLAFLKIKRKKQQNG